MMNHVLGRRHLPKSTTQTSWQRDGKCQLLGFGDFGFRDLVFGASVLGLGLGLRIRDRAALGLIRALGLGIGEVWFHWVGFGECT